MFGNMYQTYIKHILVLSLWHKSNANVFEKQEANADPALKPDVYIFLIFQHKWMIFSTMQHCVWVRSKSFDKVITEIQNFSDKVVKEQCLMP